MQTSKTSARACTNQTETQMRAGLSSSDFYRKAPPEACLTNMALILTARPRFWPPTSLPRGDPNPLCSPITLLHPREPWPRPSRPPWAQNTLNPQPGLVVGGVGGGGTTVTRGAHNVWTQSPAHDKPAMHSHTRAHTPHYDCMQTHTPTPALIHQWGLTHIKVRWSWLGWVIGVLWGDGEMLKTQAWKNCCVQGSEGGGVEMEGCMWGLKTRERERIKWKRQSEGLTSERRSQNNVRKTKRTQRRGLGTSTSLI